MIRGAQMNRRAIVSIHTGLWFIVGIVMGAAIMYYAALQGWIPFGVGSS